MPDMKTCPSCLGGGKSYGIACSRGGRSQTIEMTCLTCGGLTKLPAELVAAIVAAEEVAAGRRRERLNASISVVRWAEDRGMKPIAYNRWERNAGEVNAAHDAARTWAEAHRA